jgi:hypothetical protein
MSLHLIHSVSDVFRAMIVVSQVMTPRSIVLETNASDGYITSIIRVGLNLPLLKIETAYFFEALVLTYECTRCHNIEDHDLNFLVQYNFYLLAD